MTRNTRSKGSSVPKTTIPLKWSSQWKQIQQAFQRMYQDLSGLQTLTDVTLVSSEGELIEAHSTILAMISPYFQRVFSKAQRTRKAANTMIILGNVKLTNLRNLLRFVYNGEVDATSHDDVHELAELAKIFEIEGLLSACEEHSEPTETAFTCDTGTAEEADDDEKQNNDYFEDFQTAASENEADNGSEPEMKVSALEQTSPNYETDKDFVASDSDNQNQSDSSYDGGKKRRKKKRKTTPTPVPVKSPRTESNNGPSYERRLHPKTGALVGYRGGMHNWIRQEPIPDEEIEENFRVFFRKPRKQRTQICYYCNQATSLRKCPVLLKKEVWNNGYVEFYRNDAEHSSHRPDNYVRGLTNKEKEFVLKIFDEKGIFPTPSYILKSFREAGKPEPDGIKLKTFLRSEKDRRLAIKRTPKKVKGGASKQKPTSKCAPAPEKLTVPSLPVPPGDQEAIASQSLSSNEDNFTDRGGGEEKFSLVSL